MATIQGIYVALFGRPADPEGLQFWSSLTDNGSDLTELVGRLTAEPEALARFDNLDSEAVVSLIYQSIFGRAPDAEGLAFYTAQLESGALTLETIAINILDGAQGPDLVVAENKVEVANIFTASLDTPEEIAAYVGDNAADIARQLIQKVTADPATIPTPAEIEKTIDHVESGNPPDQPPVTPPPPPPTGGGDTPAPLEKFTVTHSEADIFAVVADDFPAHTGYLYAGIGNPGTGMMTAVALGERANIELALDARLTGNTGNIAASQVSGDTATYVVAPGNDLRFAYSVGVDAKQGGPFASDKTALDNYDFRLLIDTDPGEGETFITFNLVTQNTGDPKLNVSNSPYEWVGPDGRVIADDGGNGNITQNIQSFDWYNGDFGGIRAGDVYDVKLQAFHKGTTTQIAETEITIRGADLQVVGQNLAEFDHGTVI